MLIQLRRSRQNRQSTVGQLFVDEKPICWTLEDAFHMVKMPGITRIPPGTYTLRLRTEGGMHARYLERFGPEFHKGMLWIRDIPDFEYVYPHCGNRVEDTNGCPLVGSSVVEPEGPDAPYTLLSSEKAYREFYPIPTELLVRKESVFFQIVDPKGAWQ